MLLNLACRPIASVLQCLYLSIVVLGVLQPLLVQNGRRRRKHAACDAALAVPRAPAVVPPT